MRRAGFVVLLVVLAAAAWWAASSTRTAPRSAPPPAPTPDDRRHDPSVYASITQILLVYRTPAHPEAKRTRAEARVLADRLLDRVRAGEEMESLVSEFTDDRTVDGKVFNDGTQIVTSDDASMPTVKRAVFSTKPGEAAREPVDTGAAVLVFRRDR